MEEEVWKPISVVPGYSVSSLGRVRRDAGGRGSRGGIRKLDLVNTGYLRVRLSYEGRQYHINVHRLVALAFLGDPPTDRHQVSHNDNDRTNNRVENLRWATPLENMQDKKRHGTLLFGMTHPRAKLTDADVLAIRASDTTNRDAAEMYGVTKDMVRRIRCRIAWKHLP